MNFISRQLSYVTICCLLPRIANTLFAAVLIFSMFLPSAQGQLFKPRPAQQQEPAVPETTPENDVARFLAGLPVWAGSPLAEMQTTKSYARHRTGMGELARIYQSNFFDPMRTWSSDVLDQKINPRLPLVYFFGGPDVINERTLFPQAPLYLMCGLEPPGKITAPTTLPPEQLAAALANLRESVKTVLTAGFFITKDMKKDLADNTFTGILPLTYVFIALTGGDVSSTVYFSVDAEGNSTDGLGQPGLPGVRTNFHGSPGASVQTIAFLQANLANDALAKNSGPMHWVAKFGPANAYLKAASYLMHHDSFSTVRNFLLVHSQAILEDDSGIPYRSFQPDLWHLTLYGKYGLIEIFKNYYQKDLDAAFQADTVQPLPFGTGYKFQKGQSHLLLAVKPGGAQVASQITPIINEPPAQTPETPEASETPETPDTQTQDMEVRETTDDNAPTISTTPTTERVVRPITEVSEVPGQSEEGDPDKNVPYRPAATTAPAPTPNSDEEGLRRPVPAESRDTTPQPNTKPHIIIGGDE